MRRFKDVASLLHSLAIMSQTCSHDATRYCSEMRRKCETDIQLFEDEGMFCRAYFALASNDGATQEEQRVYNKNDVSNEGAKAGYDVPSYEQLAASLVQLDRPNY